MVIPAVVGGALIAVVTVAVHRRAYVAAVVTGLAVAVALVRLVPHVVLMDIRMPKVDGTMLSPSVLRRLLDHVTIRTEGRCAHALDQLRRLSDREREVAACIAGAPRTRRSPRGST